jgi:hypothetical protein
LPEPGGQGEATLAGTDDDHLRFGVGELPLGLALFEPAAAGTLLPVTHAFFPAGAERLLEALESVHRREHRPGLPGPVGAGPGRHHPEESAAAGDRGLEIEEGLHPLGVLVDFDESWFFAVGQPEAGGAGAVQRRGQGAGDGPCAAQCPQVPGEGEEVAPPAVGQEEGPDPVAVPLLQRGCEISQPPAGDRPGRRIGPGPCARRFEGLAHRASLN